MKKKPLKMILPAILMGLMVVFSACQESEDIADKGRETAKLRLSSVHVTRKTRQRNALKN